MCTYDVYVLVHTYRQLTYIPAKVVFIFDYLANVITYFSNGRSTCLVKRDTDELMTLTSSSTGILFVRRHFKQSYSSRINAKLYCTRRKTSFCNMLLNTTFSLLKIYHKVSGSVTLLLVCTI